jgi:ferredoxin
MIKVHVDMNLCQSHGECEHVAPEVFQLGDDDMLRWEEEVDDSLREKVLEAAEACPMMAIRIEETD